MSRFWWAALGAVGVAGVAAGAFGAHGLEDRLSEQQLGWWALGARYAMLHLTGLLAVAVLDELGAPGPLVRASGAAFLVGIALFSGSLCTMALTDARWLGMITPLGGLSLMAGWGLLAWTGTRPRRPRGG